MTNTSEEGPNDTRTQIAELWRIHEWMQRFEEASERGQTPHLDTFLEQVPGDVRAILRIQLSEWLRRRASPQTSHGLDIRPGRSSDPSHSNMTRAELASDGIAAVGIADSHIADSRAVDSGAVDSGAVDSGAVGSGAVGSGAVGSGDSQSRTVHTSHLERQPSSPIAEASSAGEDSKALKADRLITDAPSLVGQALAHFRLDSELGRGATAIVYRAHDMHLKRDVAIKVPIVEQPSRWVAYYEEAQRAAAVEHVGIVPIYHVGRETSGRPYVVQKLIDGQSLRKFLERQQRIAPELAVRILLRITEAVHAAHEKKLIHRDLKPDNVLIDSVGSVYVADFGMAIATEVQEGARRGPAGGTPVYMSPEQARGEVQRLDVRTDVWALGVVLFEMVVGKRPFRGRNWRLLTESIYKHRPEIPEAIDHQVALQEIFRRCCAKSRAHRYPTARDLAIDLERLLSSMERANRDAFRTYAATPDANDIVDSNADSPTGTPVSSPYDSTETIRQEENDRLRLAEADTARQRSTQAKSLPLVPQGSNRRRAVTVSSIGICVTSAVLLSVWFRRFDGKELDVVPARIPRVVVAADGSADATDLASALARATSGATIILPAGRFEASLEIAGDLTVEGAGADATTIVGTKGGALRVQSGRLQLSGLTIEPSAAPEKEWDERWLNTVLVREGSVTLSNCVLPCRQSNPAVRVEAGHAMTGEGCRFEPIRGQAIVARGQATITMKDCSFLNGSIPEGWQPIAVRIEPSTNLQLQGCKFVGLTRGIDARMPPGAAASVVPGSAQSSVETDQGIRADSQNPISSKVPHSIERCTFREVELGLLLERGNWEIIQSTIENASSGLTLAAPLDSTRQSTRIELRDLDIRASQSCVSTTFVDGTPPAEAGFDLQVTGGTWYSSGAKSVALFRASPASTILIRDLAVQSDGQNRGAVYLDSGVVTIEKGRIVGGESALQVAGGGYVRAKEVRFEGSREFLVVVGDGHFWSDGNQFQSAQMPLVSATGIAAIGHSLVRIDQGTRLAGLSRLIAIQGEARYWIAPEVSAALQSEPLLQEISNVPPQRWEAPGWDFPATK
jgi:serine/threonine protein kinase